MPKLNRKQLFGFSFSHPPLPEQRRIVAELDALQAEVDALKRLQAETAAELAPCSPPSSTVPSKENYDFMSARKIPCITPRRPTCSARQFP